jgi:hypothetical protein
MKKIFVLLSILGIFGCNEAPYLEENSAYIVFKTPTFRYADMGFVYKNPNKVKLQIYSNAQSIMSLVVPDDSVCMSALECMSTQAFNSKVLSRYYPKQILQHILTAQEIFGAKNIIKTRQGFGQKIKSDHYDIVYEVNNKKVLFVDKTNHIKIQIITQ